MVAPPGGVLVTAKMAFVQFQRCDICRRNHDSGNKHVYSAAHKSNVQRIIRKFKDKVRIQLVHVKSDSLCTGWVSDNWVFPWLCCMEIHQHKTWSLSKH